MMMRWPLKRLLVIQKHVTSSGHRLSTAPTLVVTPTTSLVDEQVQIKVTGVLPNQFVKLVAGVEENKIEFESYAVYRANTDGIVDLNTDASVSGTYIGTEHMGLFWSLETIEDRFRRMRLMKRDITTPSVYTIKLYNYSEDYEENKAYTTACLSECTIERFYVKKGVKRVPITDGKFRGVIFVPAGEGPFPGLIDMYGGLVVLMESRAALLASRGYATFALTYLYKEDLPQRGLDADPLYIAEALDWFSEQPYVDERRLGAVGSSYGGFMTLLLATLRPKVRVVVTINGQTFLPSKLESGDMSVLEIQRGQRIWGKSEVDYTRAYVTPEGVAIIADVLDKPNPQPIPAWQHGAKLMLICGEEDGVVSKKWHNFYKKRVPEEYRDHVQFLSYPGAGHQIEPPYAPNYPLLYLSKNNLDRLDFLPPAMRGGEVLLAGGHPKEHAFAQEDSWKKLLEFLKQSLCVE